MIKNIVFDIGNVLIDFRPAQVLEELGVSEQNREAVLDATVRGPLWIELDRGVIPEEEVIARMREQTPEEAREDFDRFFREGKEYLAESYPYAKGWLKGLQEKGYRVYLLSNYPVTFFEAHSNYFTFLPYTDGRVVSAWEKLVKPDAAIYECLLRRYHLNAEECVFIDDRKENVEAARQLGMKGVQFTSYEEVNGKLQELLQ